MWRVANRKCVITWTYHHNRAGACGLDLAWKKTDTHFTVIDKRPAQMSAPVRPAHQFNFTAEFRIMNFSLKPKECVCLTLVGVARWVQMGRSGPPEEQLQEAGCLVSHWMGQNQSEGIPTSTGPRSSRRRHETWRRFRGGGVFPFLVVVVITNMSHDQTDGQCSAGLHHSTYFY